jgi:WD40 repeat protein
MAHHRVAFSFFSTDENVLMAVGYRSLPVSVCSPLELQQLGECGNGNANGILDMTFNPNSDINALILSYANGDLCVYNYATMDLDMKKPRVYSTSLAYSQDGRTLVTGSSQGMIQVFEFDLSRNGGIILIPIYRVRASSSGISSVAFNADGLRFVGISRRQCQV